MQIRVFIAAADENLGFRHAFDAKSSAAQHSFGTSAVRYPPICWVLGIAAFDKVHLWETGFIEDGSLRERIIFGEFGHGATASQHGLKNQPVFRNMTANQIESKQRIPQVIEDTEEQYEAEALAELPHLVHRHQLEGNIETQYFSSEACLLEVIFVVIDAEHAAGSAQFHLYGIKPGVTPDVEHRHATQVLWDGALKSLPLSRWIIAQEVIRSGLYA